MSQPIHVFAAGDNIVASELNDNFDEVWDDPAPLVGGVMKLLASVSLGASASTLSTGAFTAKKMLRVIIFVTGLNASATPALRFNADTGANYSRSTSTDGGAKSTDTGVSSMTLKNGSVATSQHFLAELTGVNIATIPKSLSGTNHLTGTSSAEIGHWGGTWNNTTAQITSIELLASGATLGAGTFIMVFGSD